MRLNDIVVGEPEQYRSIADVLGAAVRHHPQVEWVRVQVQSQWADFPCAFLHSVGAVASTGDPVQVITLSNAGDPFVVTRGTARTIELPYGEADALEAVYSAAREALTPHMNDLPRAATRIQPRVQIAWLTASADGVFFGDRNDPLQPR